jgi:hypothetical protein
MSALYVTLPPSFPRHLLFIASKVKDVKDQGAVATRGNEQLRVQYGQGKVPFVESANGRKLLVVDDVPLSLIQKIGIGAGIAAGSVALAVLSVVAFPFIVAGVGFGAGGIAAGSTAATMMSLGVVGVATLQSIGAAGMGVASVLIVGGTGAGFGAAIGGATLAGANAARENGAHLLPHQVNRILLVEFPVGDLQEMIDNLRHHEPSSDLPPKEQCRLM